MQSGTGCLLVGQTHKIAAAAQICAPGASVSQRKYVYLHYTLIITASAIRATGSKPTRPALRRPAELTMFGKSYIWRTLVWVARCRHSRGFGIQSPWAYRFVRYVVNEHYPYYAYGPLAAAHPDLTPATRRLMELCFRMANHLQPRTVADFGDSGEAFAHYVKAGCRKASITAHGGAELPPTVDMARFSPSPAMASLYREAASHAGPASTFIVEGIGHDRRARRLWREIMADGRTGVTFDLYYCGLAFFDKKLYKRNYIINF